MASLIAGLALFLGAHSTSIFAPALRALMVNRWGEGAWKGFYALISLAGFALICYGFGLARQTPVILYSSTPWLREFSLIVMLPVFPLLIAAYMPGRIKTAAKHPMLAAVKLWAFAHLLANGTLADVLLFGGFLMWAVADRISLKRRPAQPVPRTAPPGRFNDAIVVALGLGIYALVLAWGHARLFGVSPLAAVGGPQ